MRTSLQQVLCHAARLKKSRTHLSVHRIEAAAGPDGAFAIVGMAPCFRGSVKVATVVAARPNAVLTPAVVASKVAWAGLVWAPRPASRLAVLQCGECPAGG